jgi:two-component system, sensor histidine kinase and response regulator
MGLLTSLVKYLMSNLPYNPAGLKILLVDDVAENIRVLTEALRPDGYQLALAQSGERAIKVAEHFKPDLILLDIMMPGIDGFEVCRILKQKPEFKDVAIIFLTAMSDIDDVIKGFDAGAKDYMTKPFNEREVRIRIQTHLQLRYALQEQARLNEDKNKLLGMVAHDLRNPVGVIKGYMELLLDAQYEADELEGIHNKIFNVANEALLLINDLVDMSAIENGTLKLSKNEADLEMLVLEKIKHHRFRADQKHISLLMEGQSNAPFVFDRLRVGQVIDNLISNSIKFSPKNAKIKVAISHANGFAKVAVVDEGPGIDEPAQKTLFDSFQTAGTQSTGGESSTGLGLAIVKKIIDAHGGEVGVESTVGVGSQFYFTLPLDPDVNKI